MDKTEKQSEKSALVIVDTRASAVVITDSPLWEDQELGQEPCLLAQTWKREGKKPERARESCCYADYLNLKQRHRHGRGERNRESALAPNQRAGREALFRRLELGKSSSKVPHELLGTHSKNNNTPKINRSRSMSHNLSSFEQDQKSCATPTATQARRRRLPLRTI